MSKVLRLDPQRYTISLVINEFKPLFGLHKTSYTLDINKNKLIINHELQPLPRRDDKINEHLKRWYCFWDFFGVKATLRNLGIENGIIYSFNECCTLDDWTSSIISSSIAQSLFKDKYLDYRTAMIRKIRGKNTPNEFEMKLRDALKLVITNYDKSAMTFSTFVLNRLISLHNQGI